MAANGVFAYGGCHINIGVRFAGARVRILEAGELVHVYYGEELVRSLAPDASRRYQRLDKRRGRRIVEQRGASVAEVPTTRCLSSLRNEQLKPEQHTVRSDGRAAACLEREMHSGYVIGSARLPLHAGSEEDGDADRIAFGSEGVLL